MKLRSLILCNSLILFVVILLIGAQRAAAQNKKENATASTAKSEAVAKPTLRIRDDKNLEKIQEGPEFLRRRQEWFFKPRAFPIGFIPLGARERALQQKMQMSQRQGRVGLFAAPKEAGFLAPALGPTSTWFSIGPQPTNSVSNPPFVSGRVTALAVNPNNSNNAYLGGSDGGLWLTTDGGSTWTPLTDNPPNAGIPTVAVGAIAVDPTTCGASVCTTVYVGTGEDNFAIDNVYGEGVLNCTVAAGPPPTTSCTQDSTFHAVSPLDDTRGGPMIGALAINPKTGGSTAILLAGVRGRGTAVQSGIYCSANGGSTWTPVFGIPGIVGTDAVFASDGTAFVALGYPFGNVNGNVYNGIYKSSVPVSSCTAVKDASGTTPGGTGSKWVNQTLPPGTPASSLGRITLAIAPSATSTGTNAIIYAAIADATTFSSNFLGLIRTTNGGTNWTQLTDPLVSADTATNLSFCSGQCLFDMALAVDPASPDVVFAGGSSQDRIIRTLNGTTTATWTDITGGTVSTSGVPHVDTHAIGFAHDGSKVWVGNDGGAWSSSSPNGTIYWNDLNGPAGTSTGALNLTQFYPGISIHPSNPGFAMGGSQDNSIQVDEAWNPNNPAATALTWQVQDAVLPCDGGFTVIDPSIPSTSYGECEYFPSSILVIATTFAGDGLVGNGFLVTSGIDGTDRGSFIPPLVVDQSNSQTLYFGTCRVWQTKNAGVLWNAISPDVTTSTHPTTCPVPTAAGQPSASLSTIAVALTNSSTIYVGSDEGEIEVTSDGGTTWTSIVTTTLPARSVTQIVVDPSNAAIAYAAFSGFGTCNNSAVVCDGKGHVFKTVNGRGPGTTWVDISGTTTKLPDIPVNTIVIDPDDNTHNTLYVGTDIGAFFTTDGGVNWSVLGSANSMPNAQILSMALHDPSRTLRAATHGRGMWDLNLGPGPNTPALVVSKISPFSANAPGSAGTLTVDGTGFTSSSMVMWNGTAKTTTFVSATQLTAPITTADVAGAAVVQVNVKDGTSTSNSLPFTVLGPAPTISSVSPTSAPVNYPATTITVTGTNFGSTSKVLMNPDVGITPLATTFVSSTQLTATVPASFMANFGSTNSVGVQNPPPGGGITMTSASPPVILPTFVVVALPPPNDNFANAINITSTSFTDTRDSSGATTETNDPTPACSQIFGAPTTGRANTIWYKVVPTGSGTANIDTIGSSYDTVLSVWSGTSQTALAAVACNDDINPGIVLQSQLTGLPLSTGTTYYIMVSSFGALDPNPEAFGGKSILNFSFTGTLGGGTVATTTTVTASPTSLPAGGGSVTLTATVTGTGNGASPSGTVQFMNGNTPLGAAVMCTAVSGASSPTCKATLMTTLSFLVPPSAPHHIPPGVRVQPILLLVALVLTALLLIGVGRIPARYRRAYACAAFLFLAGFTIGILGCNGGYGGGGGGLHYDNITAVYSGDTTYAGSTSGTVQITVQ